MALPEAEVSLIESQRRKCEFLERMRVAAATRERARRLREGRGVERGPRSNDVVLARALAPQAVVLEYAAPLLRVGGALIDWRGRRDENAERKPIARPRCWD